MGMHTRHSISYTLHAIRRVRTLSQVPSRAGGDTRRGHQSGQVVTLWEVHG